MSNDRLATVFLLAQNRFLREALARILCKKEALQVVGSSALGTESLEEIILCAPDILVIDSFTTNVVHLEFAREVQHWLPSVYTRSDRNGA